MKTVTPKALPAEGQTTGRLPRKAVSLAICSHATSSPLPEPLWVHRFSRLPLQCVVFWWFPERAPVETCAVRFCAAINRAGTEVTAAFGFGGAGVEQESRRLQSQAAT